MVSFNDTNSDPYVVVPLCARFVHCRGKTRHNNGKVVTLQIRASIWSTSHTVKEHDKWFLVAAPDKRLYQAGHARNGFTCLAQYKLVQPKYNAKPFTCQRRKLLLFQFVQQVVNGNTEHGWRSLYRLTVRPGKTWQTEPETGDGLTMLSETLN